MSADLPNPIDSTDVEGDDVVTPPDHASSVASYGTTDLEAELGESLGLRLSEEEPDVLSHLDDPWTDDADAPAGRLVAQDEGAHSDDDGDLYADDIGTDSGGFSAEESAMHLEPDLDE
jgi:Family of unknown function (DUF5709)